MRKNTIKIALLIALTAGCKSQPAKDTLKDSTEIGKDTTGIEKDTAGLSEKLTAIDAFWKWFQTDEKELRSFQSDPDRILSRVLDSARKIESGLAIELEPPKNGVINMTVSADGDRNLFSLVREIVAKAPKIEGWTFFAFRQRLPKDKLRNMIIKTQGYELSPVRMKFYPAVSDDSLDIIIYTDHVTKENFPMIAYRGLILVDNILGEYDCVKKVRSYDFQNMPEKPEELQGLRPLLDLTEYVDSFYQARR